MLMGDEWLEATDFGPERYLDWTRKQKHARTFAFFRDLIGLRRSRKAFRADAPVQVFQVDEARNVLAFRRYGVDGEWVVLANFSNANVARYRVGAPVRGTWREVLNNQAPAYGGTGPVNPGARVTEETPSGGFAHSLVVDVPAMGLVVLELDGAGTRTTGP
jgi:1,4-alpha-glucan branching enzyme